MIPDSIKTMQFAKIEDVNELRKALEILLGAEESQEERIKELEKLNQKQSDELSVLKGGNARPVFRNKKKSGKNISSGGKETGSGAVNKAEAKSPREVHIDRTERISLSIAGLPADIQFKGYGATCKGLTTNCFDTEGCREARYSVTGFLPRHASTVTTLYEARGTMYRRRQRLLKKSDQNQVLEVSSGIGLGMLARIN